MLDMLCGKRMMTLQKALFMALSTLLFIACDSSDTSFRLKGKFKNFNQGELYAYSLTGKSSIDTIRLTEGKFNFTKEIEDTILLSIVFPNYSEIPVIASPATTVSMEGDASHLKEVVVRGNKENEQLTAFRLSVNDMTPPEAQKAAESFINDNPVSAANLFLLNKYFLLTTEVNYSKIARLLTVMTKASPSSNRLKEIKSQVEGLRATKVGSVLPNFTATTTKGARVTKSDLQGTVNVITVWASWNYESQRCQRELKKLKREYGSRLQLLSICIDGNPDECKSYMERDSINWYTICDGTTWKHPIISTLGINRVPDNIVVDNKGKIQARGLQTEDLKKHIEKAMK